MKPVFKARIWLSFICCVNTLGQIHQVPWSQSGMPVWPVISKGSVFSHSCSAELKNLQSLWHALASNSAHDQKYALILKLLVSWKFKFKNI